MFLTVKDYIKNVRYWRDRIIKYLLICPTCLSLDNIEIVDDFDKNGRRINVHVRCWNCDEHKYIPFEDLIIREKEIK